MSSRMAELKDTGKTKTCFAILLNESSMQPAKYTFLERAKNCGTWQKYM